MNLEALWVSVWLALMTSSILLTLGLPLAYCLAYSSRRWTFFIEAIVALPLVLPPTVLGFYLLMAMGQNTPLGRLSEAVFGTSLAFSFWGLLIASILYSFPFAIQPLVTAFRGIDLRLLNLSATLGDSFMRRFFKVVVPLSYRGITTAFILTFAHTLGEFGVVLMIGGNIPGVTRTLSIDLYDQVQALNYQGATETAAFLLVCSFLFLSGVYYLNRHEVQGVNR